MAESRQVLFHQRHCRASKCGAVFWICQCCYRGQRYCSERCRAKSRREQRREANRRHQRSPEGRLDHRDRQRAYRLRRARARVTDHTRNAPSASANLLPPEPITQAVVAASENRPEEEPRANPMVTVCNRRSRLGRVWCLICGRMGYLVDPFRRGG
jgi:hypothetical protein